MSDIENNENKETLSIDNKDDRVQSGPDFVEPDISQVMHNEFKYNRFPCTYTLIIVIGIVYLLTSFPSFQKPETWAVYNFALIPQALFEGQWWRLITPNFLHASPGHITSNVISILIWGHLLEKIISSKAMYFLVFLSCLLTTLFSAYGNPEAISLGASGVAYALMSAFIVYVLLVTFLKVPGEFQGQLFSFIVLVAVQVGYNYLNSSTVDVWGHLGGAVAGIVFIIIFFVFKTFRS